MMMQWFELLEIARSVHFADTEDRLIWQHENNGVYSSKTVYSILNFRGLPLSIYLLFGT